LLARARVSSRLLAPQCGASLLKPVGLREDFVGISGDGNIRLRKPLLQIFMLMREDTDIVLVCFRKSLPFILDAREDAAIVCNVL
jgi:hypothetical protein